MHIQELDIENRKVLSLERELQHLKSGESAAKVQAGEVAALKESIAELQAKLQAETAELHATSAELQATRDSAGKAAELSERLRSSTQLLQAQQVRDCNHSM